MSWNKPKYQIGEIVTYNREQFKVNEIFTYDKDNDYSYSEIEDNYRPNHDGHFNWLYYLENTDKRVNGIPERQISGKDGLADDASDEAEAKELFPAFCRMLAAKEIFAGDISNVEAEFADYYEMGEMLGFSREEIKIWLAEGGMDWIEAALKGQNGVNGFMGLDRASDIQIGMYLSPEDGDFSDVPMKRAFVGTPLEIDEWAKENKLRFVVDESPFGGHFKAGNNDTYFPSWKSGETIRMQEVAGLNDEPEYITL